MADGSHGAWAGLWATLLDLAVVVLLAGLIVDLYVPPQHLPWKPLRLSDPIGAATFAKMLSTGADPAACRRVLDEGGVRFAETPDRTAGGFCVIEDALRLTGGTTPLAPAGPVMTCRLALGVALWDRQVLQPAAREGLGSAVARIDHYGTYSCRLTYGSSTGRPSEHARANAFDISGVRLRDGRRITVVGDFRGEGPEGAFLRRVRDGACGTVKVVLGPDYNAAHRDHFHFDQGPFRVCR